jgi:pimeloyl-ACP methyl ester carboxylesterase
MGRASIDSDATSRPPGSMPLPISIWADMVHQTQEYWTDAWQRSILFLDVLRQRGNDHLEHVSATAPHVLAFEFDLVMDGRDLRRPVNYGLISIKPPPGVEIDPRKRPFIVFDPRAGHGPGIGGMKQDSEIGVALAAGHPCYFVGFLPNPLPGQTIEDVCQAEALFIERVIERHPQAQGKPCLIGNCQAGWQIMMTSAIHPELVGPVFVAGAPLSYWAGVHGKNPLRYLGGLLGGTWLTSLAGDLGNGIFDGAYLVNNFEQMNPANTFWEKPYKVYSNVDTEGPRFLDFERWWGSPVLLNAEEMQFIADELFIGNKLTSGDIRTTDGVRVDLRNIKSPIVVFCSWGDDITPPQQALGWILDLYADEEELETAGQTIVYSLHQTIGHLGIFVSAKVAKKEHGEFAQCMDMIDVLPPGLYEAVITPKDPKMAHVDLVQGDYVMRFERRTLDDIRALGGNDDDDDLKFATVARISEINQGLYRTLWSPLIRSVATSQSAEWLRGMHPHRVKYEIFSDRNPAMRMIEQQAKEIRASRKPVGADNPLLAMQETLSQQIIANWEAYGALRDRLTETVFMNVYGSPLLQAFAGLRTDQTVSRDRIGRDVAREEAAAKVKAEFDANVAKGGLAEAIMRSVLYIGRPIGGVDERAFGLLRRIRADHPGIHEVGLQRFKEIVRSQHRLLRLNEEEAIAAVPALLPGDAAKREEALKVIRQLFADREVSSLEVDSRLARVEKLFSQSRDEVSVHGKNVRSLRRA